MSVDEENVWLVDAEEEWAAMREHEANGRAPSQQPPATLRFVPLADFVAVDEPGADPLLGDPDDVLIPQGGDVMIFGDGGAGKTTLAVDLAFHLAAGVPWLGIPISAPVRVGVVENEGPRPLFRKKLRRKLDTWTGSHVDDRVHVHDHPWAELTFADEQQRAFLADAIAQLELDILFAGPLTRIGMNEAGTLQQTRDFAALLADVRSRAQRPVTFALVHHENKAGDVSGAWEGAGDTLLHVTGQGHGRTRLTIAKARWASSWHGKSLNLVWAAGDGFIVDDTERDDASIGDDLLAYVYEHGDSSWREVEKNVTGAAAVRLRRIRDELLTSGRLIDANAGKTSKGMSLWHADDPACPQTVSLLVSQPGHTDTPSGHNGSEE